MTNQQLTHDTMKFERRIDAPLQRVWDAYADVDQRAVWSVPEGEAIEYGSSNFETGGVDDY